MIKFDSLFVYGIIFVIVGHCQEKPARKKKSVLSIRDRHLQTPKCTDDLEQLAKSPRSQVKKLKRFYHVVLPY